MQKKKNFQEEAILITSLKQISELKKEYSQSQKVKFICKDCGKEFKTILKLTTDVKQYCKFCKIKHTNLERYGVTSAAQSDVIKAKALKTCMDKYGGKSSLCNKEVKQKAIDTCIKKYGVDNVFKSKKIQAKIKDTLINTYGVDNASKSEEIKKKKEATFQKTYGVSYPSQSPVIKQKVKETVLEHYGVDNVAKSPEVKASMMKTSIERYGVPYPQKSEVVKNKTKTTCMDKYGFSSYLASNAYKEHMKQNYGYEYALQSPELKQKFKETSLNNYGTEFPMQNVDLQKSIAETCMTKYGVSNPLKLPGVPERALKALQEHNMEKYGVPYAFQAEEVQNKIKKTCMEKYGVSYALQAKEVREKLKQSNIAKYGVPHAPSSKYTYPEALLDSSWEIYFFVYYVALGKSPIFTTKSFTYTYDGKEHIYYPDFEMDGSIYEVKGDQFIKDGKMVNPYDASQNGLFEAKHQCMIQNNVIMYTSEQMKPIIKWVDEHFTKDFIPLFQKDLPFPYPTTIRRRDDIIRVYHKSIWSANRGGCKSPLEAWNDKSLVLKTALNRLRYIGHCTPIDIRNGFNIAKIAPKVSVFTIGRAEYLISKYLSSYDTVFDPFSGFSGRMLGSIGLKKTYIGQDLNEDHVRESNEIIQDFKIEKATVTQADILQSPGGEYPCLFTCPPYGGKEHWGSNVEEIEKSCDDWIDICLSKFKCKTYLFVVDVTTKYKDKVVETFINRSHFGANQEFVIKIGD